jgi:hypothetical protein
VVRTPPADAAAGRASGTTYLTGLGSPGADLIEEDPDRTPVIGSASPWDQRERPFGSPRLHLHFYEARPSASQGRGPSVREFEQDVEIRTFSGANGLPLAEAEARAFAANLLEEDLEDRSGMIDRCIEE